jgi:hypothetical protein
MAAQFTNSYTSEHAVQPDGSLTFLCSTDTDKWPWLTLGPHHPITVQAQNFWTSVGAILALGGMEEGQWSALTWTDWQCGAAECGMAIRGVYSREKSGESESYLITLFDAQDRQIVQMRGRGVVFRNRNFEDWRGKSKKAAKREVSAEPFAFAPREALGIGPSEHALISDLAADGQTIAALVSRENGLPPANPMISGSGDHVNSVHIVEAARQALCLIEGDPALAVTGGEMELNRYVELGTPFALKIVARSDAEVCFELSQLDRSCAKITLRWRSC